MRGRSWAADLPTVTSVPAGEPKPFTLILPYYENPEFFRRQVDGWREWPAWRELYVSAIVVDDGSPHAPAASVWPAVPPFPMRLFRIGVDIRWNWIAARNIGMHEAAAGWCVLTDMDHVMPAATAHALITGTHDPARIYGFRRVEHTGAALAPHPNSWYLTREMFWRVGGYDERLSGYYGTDGSWRRRCAAAAQLAILETPLIRYEYQADSSTRRYARKQPIDATVGRLLREFGDSPPRVLSFPYGEVRLEAR